MFLKNTVNILPAWFLIIGTLTWPHSKDLISGYDPVSQAHRKYFIIKISLVKRQPEMQKIFNINFIATNGKTTYLMPVAFALSLILNPIAQVTD